MAVVGYTVDTPSEGEIFPEGVRVIKWGSMLLNDTGAPYTAPHYSDKSVQATGTFGVAGTVTMEGSNVVTGADIWDELDVANAAAACILNATDSLEQVLENTWKIRPNVTGGDGTTSLTVRMLINTMARR